LTGMMSVIAILRQLTVLPCSVVLAITAHQSVTHFTDRHAHSCWNNAVASPKRRSEEQLPTMERSTVLRLITQIRRRGS